jgi:NADH-quinone oxidoreductase subunit D
MVDDFRKTTDVEVPKRAQYLSYCNGISKITDHICNSILGVDTGAYTGFLYVFSLEKSIWDLWRNLCARLTTNMGRIGGFERDWSPELLES